MWPVSSQCSAKADDATSRLWTAVLCSSRCPAGLADVTAVGVLSGCNVFCLSWCILPTGFGTAMGSPVSVTVANLVMEDVEARALSSFVPSPRFWKRYVDDTCCALPETDLPRFLAHLNSIEPTIQFTCEPEKDDRLPFLDVQLHHHLDGSISTSVYRKPTHTDKYLDFRSHHPLQHKASVVRTLCSCVGRLCSDGHRRVAETSGF